MRDFHCNMAPWPISSHVCGSFDSGSLVDKDSVKRLKNTIDVIKKAKLMKSFIFLTKNTSDVIADVEAKTIRDVISFVKTRLAIILAFEETRV
jgi:hypothetical protein